MARGIVLARELFRQQPQVPAFEYLSKGVWVRHQRLAERQTSDTGISSEIEIPVASPLHVHSASSVSSVRARICRSHDICLRSSKKVTGAHPEDFLYLFGNAFGSADRSGKT